MDSICDELYAAEPDGLSGNEDCGQMSSWYVWSALGLYPVTPGSDVYVFGTPRFDAASWSLPNGAVLEIVANRESPESVFLHGWSLDGVPQTRSWVTHAELMSGGQWAFDLRDEPVAEDGFGKRPEDWPVSDWSLGEDEFVATPYIRAPRSYSDRLNVPVGCIDAEATVLHRVLDSDGEGDAKFQPVVGPIHAGGDADHPVGFRESRAPQCCGDRADCAGQSRLSGEHSIALCQPIRRGRRPGPD